MEDTTPIILDDLTKYYGDIVGIKDLSFEVGKSEIFGFLGPNGAGKSTAIRTILGFLKATSGDAYIFGYDISKRNELIEAKKRIGHIPGDLGFYEDKTGEEVLDYFGSLKGDNRKEELKQLFSFPEQRKVKEYSRGNKQKLAIVQAFMHNPELVIMDEPTSGLDPLLQNTFYDFIEEEKSKGKTIFFSSHIMSEVRKVCDRVAIIKNGELVDIEDISSLIEKSGKIVKIKFRENISPDRFLLDGVENVDIDDDGYINLVLTSNYREFIECISKYNILDIEIRETSLEDIFIHFYKEKPHQEGEKAS